MILKKHVYRAVFQKTLKDLFILAKQIFGTSLFGNVYYNP